MQLLSWLQLHLLLLSLPLRCLVATRWRRTRTASTTCQARQHGFN